MAMLAVQSFDTMEGGILGHDRIIGTARRRILAAALVLVACLPAPVSVRAAAPEICPGRLSLASSRTPARLALVYCTSHSLHRADASIQRLVVVIHGSSLNAGDHERYVADAARAASVTHAIILAPQFLSHDMLTAAGLPSSTLYWGDGWKDGRRSATTPAARPWAISSFAALDALIAAASNRRLFPNLRQVTVVGHSAGGQFVQRYAGETRVQRKLAALRNSYRYIVSNPSSYMYLSAARYHPAKRAFGPLTAAEVRSCPRYNRYKHGLQALNLYGTVAGASGIRRQYASQSIVYLLGGADTDRNDPTLDHSCAAMWQGGQRLERGRLFHRSLIAIFGSSITRRHRLVVVPGVAHDARAMYTSAAGRAALFP